MKTSYYRCTVCDKEIYNEEPFFKLKEYSCCHICSQECIDELILKLERK